ncbi:MAG TPA: ATP-binding protein [Spongiibacteraceae bacterium]|jgi:signal transduction histidine kinase
MLKEHITPLFLLTARAEQLRQQGHIAIEVARQSVKVRALQARDSVIAVVGAAAVITLIYLFFVPPWRIIGWMLPIVTSQITNQFFSLRILRWIDRAEIIDIVRGERCLTFISIAAAMAMGAGIWWIGGRNEILPLWYATTMIQCLYAIGDTVDNSTNVPSARASIGANLISVAVFWALSGGANIAVAIPIAALVIFLSGYALYFKKNFEELIQIRFENLDLVRSLEIEKQAAEQANLAKSRFLAAASHDLRQPLHALMLFSGMLNSSSPEQTQTMIAHIHHAADSLNKLFGGLLDLSQLDAGVVNPSVTCVRIGPIIASIAREIQPRADGKGISFTHTTTDFTVKTDPLLFERILRNLADNAIKYTESGKISITASVLEDKVLVIVRDTGVGIAEDMQVKIFDEFFQVHNPARNIEKGTGLGLAIVQRLCQLLDHRLMVQSVVGVGSEFTLLLNAENTQEFSTAERLSSARAENVPQDLIIVVVEDDARVRFAMKSLLESWKCRALVYECCTSALSNLAEEALVPDTLIADFRLADGSNGFEAITAFRNKFGAQFPAAIFTGDTEEHLRYVQTMPDVPVFQKPVQPEEIAQWLIDVTSCSSEIN